MEAILSFFNENIIGILLLFGAGLFFIVKGGDFFVDAASWLAEISGIPKFIIGATVVSLATTLPELLTSAFATVEAVKSPLHEGLELAIGNAVGSVTANIGLILGISLVCIPSVINRREFAGQAVLMLGAGALLCGVAAVGSISLWASAVLLLFFAVFMYFNVRNAFRNRQEATVELKGERPTGKIVAVNVVKKLITDNVQRYELIQLQSLGIKLLTQLLGDCFLNIFWKELEGTLLLCCFGDLAQGLIHFLVLYVNDLQGDFLALVSVCYQVAYSGNVTRGLARERSQGKGQAHHHDG